MKQASFKAPKSPESPPYLVPLAGVPIANPFATKFAVLVTASVVEAPVGTVREGKVSVFRVI